MARYIHHNLRVEVLVYTQEARQYSVPRSDDPRVPPRVQTIWTEEGTVPSETVSLPMNLLPFVHPSRHLVSCSVDCRHLATKPMLVHTVRGTKSLYTVLRIVRRGGAELRRYVYQKHKGDLTPVPVAEKQRWTDAKSAHRFDVASLDGACQLELHVPVHLDGMIDCFNIHRMGFFLHKHELFPHVPRPALAFETTAVACHVQVAFYDMAEILVCQYHARGTLALEPPAATASAAPSPPPSSVATAVQDLQVFKATFTSIADVVPWSKLHAPGIICLSVFADDNPSTSLFHVVCLHAGATDALALTARWVPGLLEYALAPQTLERRPLKGWLTLTHATTPPQLQLVFQHLTHLDRFAARLVSSTGLSTMPTT
ncbi:Aste57867_24400 [Aphanomyces stellatus]|uniref:Aste57867_24400 protein n=1 Tax=Aphanomyces stellatus TaxID=120398 RepID=A0A485LQC1_9STRA|nr:hypothetical protein As57867_024324 [Aphanomyces stellatus]VFU01040.1 Aste57867_24400 [Aphanomyces stellatus]